MTTLLTPTVDLLPAYREFHWTAEAFYQALNAGAFREPNQLELIHGRILEKVPQSPIHTAVRRRLARSLRAAAPRGLYVCEENPVHIAFDGEPIPDVVVLYGGEGDYEDRHPISDDVALLIEVSVTSAEYDLGDKALLYAQAGIGDYWVVLPEAGEIVVHREPSPEGYRSVTRVGEDGTVAPLAAPPAALSVRELLGRSREGESP